MEKVNVMLEYLSADLWDWIEMKICPENLVMTSQKVKTKTATQNGIFYHHWGDDHQTIKIGGTVGNSGMKGLEKIENLYMNTGLIVKPDEIIINSNLVKQRTITAYIEDRIYDCTFDSFSYKRVGDSLVEFNIQLAVTNEHKLEEA